jgi:hypothetical protein
MTQTTKIMTTEQMTALDGCTIYPDDVYKDLMEIHNHILKNFTVTRWESTSRTQHYECEGLGIKWKLDVC